MDRSEKSNDQLAALAEHLKSRRAAILAAWSTSVANDRELTAPSSLPRSQFNDHIPGLLDAFEKRLRSSTRSEAVHSEQAQKQDAASHGLLRWQQGYRLREVTLEWGHLQMCLVDELESYSANNPDLEPQVMSTAWRALAELCGQGVSESTTQYFELERIEAAGHVRDMEQTLQEVRELERRRTQMFRQAAHDLRGNLGVVHNVAEGLTQDSFPQAMRDEFLTMLQQSVKSLKVMLDEVMDLARLQAGHELRNVKEFDAAALLRELATHLQPLGTSQNLFLKADGPESFIVEGDAAKIWRVTQNLLLNALKYTAVGGVTLSWGDSRNNDPKRWMIYVEDTGPGIHAGPGAPLVEALQGATAESLDVDDKQAASERHSEPQVPHPSGTVQKRPPDTRPVFQVRGEGIGLSIVKRLCELLDASIEVESIPNQGTIFRVVLPRHYNLAETKQ